MALFKTFKGTSTEFINSTVVNKATDGYAYFTTDDGKFYIDIAGDGTQDAVIGTNRIPISGYKADILSTSATPGQFWRGDNTWSNTLTGSLVTGSLTANNLTASQAVSTDANKQLVSTNLTVSDPTASGTGIEYISSISQSAVGKITATKSTIRDASASQSGIVSTGAQTFAGDKTFSGNVNLSSETTADSLTVGNLQVNGSAAFLNTINGNAATATGFASAKTIALTGNVTGSASGGNGSNGWSIATTIGTGVVTNAMLAGSIANNKLTNSSISIAGNSVSLGGSLGADTLRTSLGLSSAMHFKGTTTTAITDESTTNPITINNESYTAAAGDVVLREVSAGDVFEYVWTGSSWEMLGRDTSFKVTQSAVASPSASGSTTAFIDTISQDVNGNITVTKKNLDTSGTWSGTATTATQVEHDLTIGEHVYDGSADVTVPIYDGENSGTTSSEISDMLRELEITSQITAGAYDGVDLTTKFADEIAAAPYNGDAWAWIKARVDTANFYGIHVCDWIPFVANGDTYHADIIGINTYKGYGHDVLLGNHIDFMCKEVWPDEAQLNVVKYNNGLFPEETLSADGATTAFTLTKPMYAIKEIKQNGWQITNWTYDNETCTLTFATAPSAGTLTVTGAGSKTPIAVSELYHRMNSLAGHIPNGETFNPPLLRVDFTEDGVYHYLPAALKAVMADKTVAVENRWNASELLTDVSNTGFTNLGKLWLLHEIELNGKTMCSSPSRDAVCGPWVQYPYFIGSHRMIRFDPANGSHRPYWLLTPAYGNTTEWTYVNNYGQINHTNATTKCWIPICFRIAEDIIT